MIPGRLRFVTDPKCVGNRLKGFREILLPMAQEPRSHGKPITGSALRADKCSGAVLIIESESIFSATRWAWPVLVTQKFLIHT
ncbi:MAG: hypothetical protein H7829_01855 [Magnetococcus sp. THC-1_WYH]